ncbi:hypothetical protein Rhe02_89530 [Rhizocola hellebori]|uniref:Effector-associated domain-containing protein n=1 Tax=Rhizocola hellebori TaxID=1392758 RepID=A0A8J3VM65_9ACTN|nr:effector-associated domain EAD1-containing protein [Rhizocola hellebori]GIH10886.1 hypothetical protein Rhe02_89530 [Rhizocola hellebori]
MAYSIPRFIEELSDVYIYPEECQALASAIRYPAGRLPNWQAVQTSLGFWQALVRQVQAGVLEGGRGVEALGQEAWRMYPSNTVFQWAATGQPVPPAPAPQQQQQTTRPRAQRPPATPAPPPRPAAHAAPAATPFPASDVGPYRVMELTGSERYAEMLEVMQGLDPNLDLLWSQFGQLAVRLRNTTITVNQATAAIAARLRETVQGTVRDYAYRPHLFQRLTVQGPDNQSFDLSAVPNTTLVSEVPQAVLDEYRAAVTDRLGRRMRTVVDLVHPGGRVERLQPGRTLHEAGVTEGALLRVSTETTAGRGDLDYRIQALRARNEILDFAEDHPDLLIVNAYEPRDLPAEYHITLTVPGIARGAGGGVPVPIAKHEIAISLPPGAYPLHAPTVYWRTDVFHPNIGVRDVPLVGTVRRLCLGILDKYYVKEMNFGELCQMIIDVASYEQYTLPASEDPGGPGVFNQAAADWATSGIGQEMILSIGGAPKESRRAIYAGESSSRPLRVAAKLRNPS